jgi:hypothetical protein
VRRALAASGNRFAAAAFRLAQRRAESMAFKQRKAVLASDTWLDESLSFAGAGS